MRSFLLAFFLFHIFYFSSALELVVQIMDWRQHSVCAHLLQFTGPRFELTLSKFRVIDTDKGTNMGEHHLPKIWTGKYDRVSIQLPVEWVTEMVRDSRDSTIFVDSHNLFKLGIAFNRESPIGKPKSMISLKPVDLRLKDSEHCFLRVHLLPGIGQQLLPVANIEQLPNLDQWHLPLRHLLFKMQTTALSINKPLIKRIECPTSPYGNGWSIGDGLANPKVPFGRGRPVCDGDIYLMHFSLINEGLVLSQTEASPQEISCDEAIHEPDLINQYNIEFDPKTRKFTCRLGKKQLGPAAIRLILDHQRENVLPVWGEVTRLQHAAGNNQKPMASFQHTTARARPNHQQLTLIDSGKSTAAAATSFPFSMSADHSHTLTLGWPSGTKRGPGGGGEGASNLLEQKRQKHHQHAQQQQQHQLLAANNPVVAPSLNQWTPTPMEEEEFDQLIEPLEAQKLEAQEMEAKLGADQRLKSITIPFTSSDFESVMDAHHKDSGDGSLATQLGQKHQQHKGEESSSAKGKSIQLEEEPKAITMPDDEVDLSGEKVNIFDLINFDE